MINWICYSHKKFKASIKSWISFEKDSWIKFNQKAWLNPYIVMNAKLRQIARNNFEEDFFELMNNVVFWKNYRKFEKT